MVLSAVPYGSLSLVEITLVSRGGEDPMNMWKDRVVVITGGSGFLGGAVKHLLKEAGASVYAPKHRDVDLLFPVNLASYMYELPEKVDTAIHLAAKVGGIGAVSNFPFSFMHENLVMGANVLGDCVTYGVDHIIYANSVCAYPLEVPVPTTEDAYWLGRPEPTNAPYGLAKKAIGELLFAARDEYGIKAANLVFANMYGPRDNFNPISAHVIPSLIRRMSEAKKRGDNDITIWGTGKPSRDFLYVEDAARAILLSGGLDYRNHLNVASGQETTILEVAQIIRDEVGFQGPILLDSSRPDGQPRRLFDASEFMKITGWEPLIDFPTGIRRTVEWYKEKA